MIPNYHGPLSNYAEWHMLIIGLAVGAILAGSETLRGELAEQPHYFVGGALLAYWYSRQRG